MLKETVAKEKPSFYSQIRNGGLSDSILPAKFPQAALSKFSANFRRRSSGGMPAAAVRASLPNIIQRDAWRNGGGDFFCGNAGKRAFRRAKVANRVILTVGGIHGTNLRLAWDGVY